LVSKVLPGRQQEKLIARHGTGCGAEELPVGAKPMFPRRRRWENLVKRQLLAFIAFAGLGMLPAQGQDAAKGEAAFTVCAACHDIGENAHNRMGPVLTGVVGRKAGTYEGFKYSGAMVEAGDDGLMWTPETLDKFLAGPRDFVKGTKMNGISVKDASKRADIIAYLATFSDSSEEGGQPK
jgi:cytochrome c